MKQSNKHNLWLQTLLLQAKKKKIKKTDLREKLKSKV